MTKSPAERSADVARDATDRLDELRTFIRVMASELGDDARILNGIAETLLGLTGALSVQVERHIGGRPAEMVATAGDPVESAVADPEGTGRLVIALGRRNERLGSLILHRPHGAPAVGADDVERISDLTTLATLALRRLALHDEIRTARGEARRIIEDKYRLASGIADEVRDRLGVAVEYVQLLDIEGDLSESEERYIDRSRDSIKAVIGVINDLEQLSRLDTGRIALRPEAVNVGALVRGMVRDYELSVATMGFDFEVAVPDLPVIETDIDAARQILENLLSNAVRYSPVNGRIAVRAEVRPSRLKTGPLRFICISVTDSGPGIEDETRVFEETWRAERPGERPGFRLAISRRVARLLGGDLTLATETGKGSTFTLLLPDSPPVAPPGYSALKKEPEGAAR